MKQCSQCGKQLDDAVAFCDQCGAKQEEHRVYCSACGTKMPETAAVCPQCGFRAEEEPDKPHGKEEPAEKKTTRKKKFILLAAAVAVLAVVVVLILLFGGKTNGANANCGLYLSDGALFAQTVSRKEEKPEELTTELCEDREMEEYLTEIMLVYTAQRGSRVFFPDRLDGNDDGVSIYYRDLQAKDPENVKIDSDIIKYYVNGAGTRVTYLKEARDGTLYQTDLENREKIAAGVSTVEVSPDGSVLYYVGEDNNLYRKTVGEESEKLDSSIDHIAHVTEDFKTVFYVKNDGLYRIGADGEKNKLTSDVYEVLRCYDTGEAYYTKAQSTDLYAMVQNQKEIDDDLAAALRDYSDEYTMPQKLFYYDGTQEILVSDSLLSGNVSVAEKGKTLVFASSSHPSPKVTVEEDMWLYDVLELAEEKIWDSYSWVLVSGGEQMPAEITGDKAGEFTINASGTELYYLDDLDYGEGCGDLYRAAVKNGQLQTPELVDIDVDRWSLGYYGETDFLYFKDVKDGSGDLYRNGTRIDYDVWIDSFLMTPVIEEDQILYYYTQWNDSKELGTLKRFDGKETKKISDDVRSHRVVGDNDVWYLYDYDIDRQTGTLCCQRDGDSTTVLAEDVTAIIVPMDHLQDLIVE